MSQSVRAYEQLREEIVSWILPPGTHLNETRLAERLGVSRTPLREAIQRLARENLVRISQGRGAFVSEIALGDVIHLYQMREAVESYAARLCARSNRRELFAELQVDFQQQLAHLNTGNSTENDNSYYALIARMDNTIDDTLRNPYIMESLMSLRGQLRRLRQLARRTPLRMMETVNEHAAICRAIADGQEDDAARQVSIHVNNSLHNTLSVLADSVGPPARQKPEHNIAHEDAGAEQLSHKRDQPKARRAGSSPARPQGSR